MLFDRGGSSDFHFLLKMNVISVFLIAGVLTVYHYISYVVLNLIPRRFRKKKDIQGQRVLITGAGNGIGRQMAIEFAKHSPYLILLDIDRASLVETMNMLDSKTTAFYYECDVSNYKKVYEVADRIKKEVGDVDILVNNAGIIIGQSLLDLTEERIAKVMEVNTLAHFWMCKAFLPSMMKKNQGHIVTIASIAGKVGIGKLIDYSTSKFAAVGLAEALEMEMKEQNLDGIKVTIVVPTPINTALWKWEEMRGAPILNPKFVAEEIVAGVLEEKETIYLPFYLRYILFLKTCAPRWITFWFVKNSGNLNVMKFCNERKKTTEKDQKMKQ